MNANAEVYEILHDPSTPFWAKDIIRVALQKDPVDVVNVLEVLAKAFDRRAQAISSSAR